MTIAMGFQCKNGVIMASDMQGTTRDGRIENLQKIHAIEGAPKALLAFSSDSSRWVERFVNKYVQAHKRIHDPLRRTELAQSDYQLYLQNQFPKHYPENSIFDGVLGFYDLDEQRPRIFEFSGVNPPVESTQTRILIGQAERTALVIVRSAEFFMRQTYADFLRWSRFSTKFVSRFTYSVLHTLPAFETSVQGSKIYQITEKGIEYLEPEVILGQFDHAHHLGALFESIREEVPPQAFMKLAERQQLIPASLIPFLSSWAKENSTW